MFGRKKRKRGEEINASSMADIAFLLLIFFLVTTTIATDKGIFLRLPPKNNDIVEFDVKRRNIYNVMLNSSSQLMVEGELMRMENLKDGVKKFIANQGENSELSENPQKAIVSVKTDRGTDYAIYLQVLDEVKRAYHELRSEKAGITLSNYIRLENSTSETEKNQLRALRDFYPMQISEAEPTNVNL